MDAVTTPLETAPAPAPKKSLVLVEDDEVVRRSLHLLLHFRGFDVRSFASAGPLLADTWLPSASSLVADYRLPDGNGLDVLRHLRAAGWKGRAVLITGYPDRSLCEAAQAAGFAAIIEKPIRQHDLLNALSVEAQ